MAKQDKCNHCNDTDIDRSSYVIAEKLNHMLLLCNQWNNGVIGKSDYDIATASSVEAIIAAMPGNYQTELRRQLKRKIWSSDIAELIEDVVEVKEEEPPEPWQCPHCGYWNHDFDTDCQGGCAQELNEWTCPTCGKTFATGTSPLETCQCHVKDDEWQCRDCYRVHKIDDNDPTGGMCQCEYI